MTGRERAITDEIMYELMELSGAGVRRRLRPEAEERATGVILVGATLLTAIAPDAIRASASGTTSQWTRSGSRSGACSR